MSQDVIVLRADRWVDVEAGQVRSPAVIVVEGECIAASAELIGVDDRGRLSAGLLADIIAVPGDPSEDIATSQDVRFVMKGGHVLERTSMDPATRLYLSAYRQHVPQLASRDRRGARHVACSGSPQDHGDQPARGCTASRTRPD